MGSFSNYAEVEILDHVVGKTSFMFPKLPKEILAIRDAGGLLPYTRKKLEKR